MDKQKQYTKENNGTDDAMRLRSHHSAAWWPSRAEWCLRLPFIRARLLPNTTWWRCTVAHTVPAFHLLFLPFPFGVCSLSTVIVKPLDGEMNALSWFTKRCLAVLDRQIDQIRTMSFYDSHGGSRNGCGVPDTWPGSPCWYNVCHHGWESTTAEVLTARSTTTGGAAAA